jgi:hypothetical protein
MKQKEKESVKETQTLFNFSLTQKELIEQTEFLYGYYVAKLKQLRNTRSYISKHRASEEILYKDIIAACACYLQEVSTKSNKNEGYIEESGEFSSGF